MPRKNPQIRSARATPAGGKFVLRIIGGEWRGRKIEFPPVAAIRPTPDRVRETLFNWLQFAVPDRRCLDLFAGSGALGLEALSRGAAEVVFVESDVKAAGQLSGNLRVLACDRGTVVRTSAQQYLEGTVEPFDVIFLDPPYAERLLAATCRRIEERGWLKPGGLVYLEDAATAGPPELPANWTLHRSKRAGEVGYHLARRE